MVLPIPTIPKRSKPVPLAPQSLLNKTFHRFLFSFIAVIAGVLLFILVLGSGGQ